MGWIFSLASEDCHLQLSHGSAPSRIVSRTDTAKLFLCRGCNQVSLMKRQSGMMCELCEEVKFTSPSTWYSEDSHARTSALQELERAWQESAVDFSSKLSDSSRKLGLLLYSSKTCQRFALADFVKLSEHLPSFGMTVAGLLCLPRRLEPRTCVKDGSFWPTPVANDDNKTPEAHMRMKANMPGGPRKKCTSLNVMVKGIERGFWPTPTASAASKGIRSPEGAKAEIARKRLNGVDLNTAVGGGKLNPTWVEWLMGFPLEWTALKPLEMPSSRKSQS